jgi:hypothetical protein
MVSISKFGQPADAETVMWEISSHLLVAGVGWPAARRTTVDTARACLMALDTVPGARGRSLQSSACHCDSDCALVLIYAPRTIGSAQEHASGSPPRRG